MNNIVHHFRRFLQSKVFFGLIVASFVVQSSWIALSADYPQAFDEEFHLGIIKAYTHYWLPFLGNQPDNANAYGAVARDPSFLYHYLMSFPYRLITHVISGTYGQVVAMRLLNVVLFTLGLVLFRQVLLRARLSRTAAHMCLFIVALIPVVPQLAGQINYDNLLMPVTAWACLLAMRVIGQVNQRRLPLGSLLYLLIVCLVGSMVKYEFVPIFAATILFVGGLTWRRFRGHAGEFRQILHDWRVAAPRLWPLVIILVVALIFFVERDIVNLIKFHDIAPDCADVLSRQQCSAYGVWYHDYTSHQQVLSKTAYVSPNPFWYLWQWVYWLWYRLFFAINGPYHGYVNYPPLPLPIACFGVLLLASLASLVRYGRKLFAENTYLAFFAFTTLLYLLALLSQGYLKYRHTAVLELMNGRYLLPVLLLGMAVGYAALDRALTKAPRIRPLLAAVVMVCFLQGGGVLTFISRSDDSWYWNSQTVRAANHTAQSVVHPLVLEGSKTYTTSMWFFN